MQPAGSPQGSGRRNLLDVPPSSLTPSIQQLPVTTSETKPVENQSHWKSFYDKAFLKLLELGIIDQYGLLTDKYSDMDLPSLKHESDRIKQFITNEVITIRYRPSQDGKEYTANVLLSNFLGYWINLCSQYQNTFIEKIEIVGGKVASFLDAHFFKVSIQKLLHRYMVLRQVKVPITDVLSPELEAALNEELSAQCYDVDLRFKMPNLDVKGREWLRSQMIYYIAANTKDLKFTGTTEECAFDNLGRVGTKSKPSLIVSVSDRDPIFETQYDLLFYSELPRKFFAGRDALKVVIFNMGWLPDPKLESDFQKGWNFVLSRCTRRLYIPDINEVNEKGWGIYKSLELRSYELVQKNAEEILLKKAIGGVPACSDKGVYFCNIIWFDLVKHHHGSNPYDATLLFISFYNELSKYLDQDELKYFTHYVRNSLKELLLWIEHLRISQPHIHFLQEQIPILDQFLNVLTKEDVLLEEIIDHLKTFVLLEMTRPVHNRPQFRFKPSRSSHSIDLFFVSQISQKSKRITLTVNPQINPKKPFPCLNELDRLRSLSPTDPLQEASYREFWSKANVDVELPTKSVEDLFRDGSNLKLVRYLIAGLDIIGAPPILYRHLVKHYPDLIFSAGTVEERLQIHNEFDRLLERSAFKEIRPFMDRCKPWIKDRNRTKDSIQAEWTIVLTSSKVKVVEGVVLEMVPAEKCTPENVELFSRLLLEHKLLQRFPGHPKIRRLFSEFAQFIHDNPNGMKKFPKEVSARFKNTFQQTLSSLIDFPSIDPFIYVVGLMRVGICDRVELNDLKGSPFLCNYEQFFFENKKLLLSNPEDGYEIITQFLIKSETEHDLAWIEVLAEIEEKLGVSKKNKFHKTLFTIFFHADLKNRTTFRKELINFLQITYYPYQKYLLSQVVRLIEDNLEKENLDEAIGLLHMHSETFQALSNDYDCLPLLFKVIKCCTKDPKNIEKAISLFEAYSIRDVKYLTLLIDHLGQIKKPETMDRVYSVLLKMDGDPAFQKDSTNRQIVWEKVLLRSIAIKNSRFLEILSMFQHLQEIFKNDPTKLQELSVAILGGCIDSLNTTQTNIQEKGISLYMWYITLVNLKLIKFDNYADADFQRDLNLITILNLCKNPEAPRSACEVIRMIFKHHKSIPFDENRLKPVRAAFKRLNEDVPLDKSKIQTFLIKILKWQISAEYSAFVIQGLNFLRDTRLRVLLLDLLNSISETNTLPKRDSLISFLDKDVSSGEAVLVSKSSKCYLTLVQRQQLSQKETKKYGEKLLSAFKDVYAKEKTLGLCLRYIRFLCRTIHMPFVDVESSINTCIPLLSDIICIHQAPEYFIKTLSDVQTYYHHFLEVPKSIPNELVTFLLPECIIPKEQSYTSDSKTFLVITEAHKALPHYSKIKSFCSSLINTILKDDSFFVGETKSILNFINSNLYQLVQNHAGGADDKIRDLIRYFIFSIFIYKNPRSIEIHRNNATRIMKLAIEKGIFTGKEFLIFRYGIWIETDAFESYAKSNAESSDVLFNYLINIHEQLIKNRSGPEATHATVLKAYSIFKNGLAKWLKEEPWKRFNCYLKLFDILTCHPLAKVEGKFLYEVLITHILKGEFFQLEQENLNATLIGSNLATCYRFMTYLIEIFKKNKDSFNLIEQYHLCLSIVNFACTVSKRCGFDENPAFYLDLIEDLLKIIKGFISSISDTSGSLLVHFSLLLHLSFTEKNFNERRVKIASNLLKTILNIGEKPLAAYLFQSLVENHVYEGFPKEFQSMMAIVPVWVSLK